MGNPGQREVARGKAADVSVGESEVADVVSKYRPQLRGAPIRFALSDFSTWEVDGQFILRFGTCKEANSRLELEAAALPVIAEHLHVRVPDIEFVEPCGEDRLVMGYRKLLGVDGERFRPIPAQRAPLVHQVAELLLALRDLPVNTIGLEVPAWCGYDLESPIERMLKYAPLILEQHGDLVTSEMAAFLHGDAVAPRAVDTRVFAHADLKGEHLLFDRSSCCLTGVLDWADMSLTDPAVDLGYLAIWLGPRFMTDVGREIGASTETLDRALFGIRSYMLIGLGATLAGERRWPVDLARTQLRWAFADSTA